MENETDHVLSAALRAVAESERELGASASVEARLKQEVGRLQSTSRRQRQMVAAVYALAAVLVMAALVPALRIVDRQPAQVSDGTGRIASEATALTADRSARDITSFVPLVYGPAPLVGGQIVRLEVPRAALARFGLPAVHAVESRPDMVLADVFVGDDGLARAVRFVQPVVSASGSRFQETQR